MTSFRIFASILLAIMLIATWFGEDVPKTKAWLTVIFFIVSLAVWF